MKSLHVLGIALVLCGLVMAGCSKSESTLVGKWVGNSGSFEFFKDKTGFIAPAVQRPGFPAKVPFTWSMEGSDEVRISLPSGGKKTAFGKLEGKNVLVIEDDKFVKQ